MKPINWDIISLTRFLLAFVIILLHLKHFADLGYILQWYLHLGFFEAILGFLLISGFSIGKSIVNNRENYFARRIKRIYPVYIATIVFQLAVMSISYNSRAILVIIMNLFFMNNLFTAGAVLRHAWTLAMEVWLYFLAPLFLIATKRILLWLIMISLLSYILYTCGRSLYDWRYYAGTNYGINLLTLAFIWIAGFCLAKYPEDRKKMTLLIAFLFLTHLAMSLGIQVVYRIKNHTVNLLLSDIPSFAGRITCVSFILAVVLLNHKIPPFRPFAHKVANLLGNISYPLYLSHYPTYLLLKKFQVTNANIYIMASVAVSFVMYYLFDFYTKKRKVPDSSLL